MGTGGPTPQSTPTIYCPAVYRTYLSYHIVFCLSSKSFIYFGRPTFQIVKLKAIGNSFDGNSYNIKTETVSIKKQFEFAKNYWNNDFCENELIETIVDGRIEVVEIVEEFN